MQTGPKPTLLNARTRRVARRLGWAALLLGSTVLTTAHAEPTVKVGVLQSLSGTMAISEVPLAYGSDNATIRGRSAHASFSRP